MAQITRRRGGSCLATSSRRQRPADGSEGGASPRKGKRRAAGDATEPTFHDSVKVEAVGVGSFLG